MQDVDLLLLREALEASWDEKTSYLGVKKTGSPALGQCYPTAWLVQQLFPEMEIIKGKVLADGKLEGHFWNSLTVHSKTYYIDLTWQQFPAGSKVVRFRTLDRNNLGDGPETIERCELLKRRVLEYIGQKLDDAVV